ncbi:hypothetical protein XI06_12985 [Bradyrhizobium sp. CCBAU 11434]|uniref:Uncharacterized protein n=1 Tax=Bradyrhizobium zhengyangense TaxID=2911009 RepID=A0ABS9M1F6_9BRAD|nr:MULTISPECIES: hypothetical protein [Bradyrhizobium]MCG2673096.1 hypothetical protein [Bradyrhizobium zhengyangense]MDA9521264.1 hypothetical protein [Bradyrhizobium sp. CCBAU 11434]
MIGSMKDENHMLFRCPCGAAYRIVPKEIPLGRAEVIFCECGRALQDKHGTRYFDYERVD